MNTYTSHSVAEMLGVPYRTLMWWVETGLLNPKNARQGRRRETIWRPSDVREASVLRALRWAGCSLQQMRRIIEYLRGLGHNPLSTGEFIVIRRGNGEPADVVKLCDTGEAISLLREPGQLVLPLWTPDDR